MIISVNKFHVTLLSFVILSILTCLPLIKTFCILLSKLRGRLFTIFTAYIWHVSTMDVLAIDFRRGRVHCSVRSIALQTASVWSVIYTVYPL